MSTSLAMPPTSSTRDLLLGSHPGNADELRRAVQAQGPEAALRAVPGGFALGLTLDDGRVLLAVDRFAEQTLCWQLTPAGELRFAARADELGAGGEIDPQAIFDYLYFHCIPSPRTIFKNVQRLPPGHYALFEQGRVRVVPYWRPEFEPAPGPQDFGALQTEFRQLLRSAVAAELDGGVPACFLSGGTDSSTVAGMIREASGQTPHCYSIGFEAEGYDEMAYARLAARHFGARHHEYYVTPDDLLRSIADVAGHYDQPFGNSSALPAYYCAQRARDDGVGKILAGDGGDELFGGNSRYAKQRVFGWYQHVPSALRDGLLDPLLTRSPLGRLPLLKKGASYVEQARVPMPARLQMYNLLLRLGPAEVLTPQFLAQVSLEAPGRHQQQVWDEVGAGSELNHTLAFDWRYTLAESDLPKVRETCALAGVGVGFPMLDRALLDFSLRLPDEYKLKGLKLRWFFKEALRGFLPDEILVKKKQGFGLPFGVWCTRHAELRALAQDSVHGMVDRGLVRADFAQRLFSDWLPAHPGYYGEMIWILMMLEQWLRRHAGNYRLHS
jgi:asparagine synthase (glutamine-hydrolysing)